MQISTQVAIIGSGPAGLLLGQLLTRAGIDNVILDRVQPDYILSRVRAGLLESGTVGVLQRADAAVRLQEEGLDHDGFHFAYEGKTNRIDLRKHTQRSMTVYGQTEVTRDLMDARASDGARGFYGVENVVPAGFDTDAPFVTFDHDGQTVRLSCQLIAGCDGFHGVCRPSVPAKAISEFEKVYPFGWLGILADVPPVDDELIYATHDRGFALCSMRSRTRSRYYVQCPAEDNVEAWSDDRFWDELRRRLPEHVAQTVITGPSFEKSIAPLRSFVAEPMRFGRMCLLGDAAHIVPPTGAKGLNLAVSDVHYFFDAAREFCLDRSSAGLDAYSERALARVWKAVRFSWWMTAMTHVIPQDGAFGRRIQRAELDYVLGSDNAKAGVAENYAGLPF